MIVLRARSDHPCRPRRPPHRRTAVHRLVVLPIGRAKRRPRMRDVAKRPKPLGEAEVVALLSSRRGHAPDAVRRLLRRDHHVIVLVDRIAVGGPRACAIKSNRRASPAQRGDESARRTLDLDDIVFPARADTARFETMRISSPFRSLRRMRRRHRVPRSSGYRRGHAARSPGRSLAPANPAQGPWFGHWHLRPRGGRAQQGNRQRAPP